MRPTRAPLRLTAATLAGVLAAASAACASASNAPIAGAGTPSQSTVRVDGGAGAAYQTRITRDDYASTSDLAVSADRAYAVLPMVYEQIGLAVNTAVSDARTIGVSTLRARRVGKDPMSRFLACGSDAVGNPIADSYAVTLTVLSRVTPSGTTGAVLSTQVIGTAQPMSVSGTTVSCQSTGALEGRIAKATVIRAAAG